MAKFDFKIEDLFDPDKMMEATVGQIGRDGPKLKTSRSQSKSGNPLNVTMFNLAELLMKAPAFDSIENVLARFESIVAGTIGGIYDKVEDFPGFESILPKDLRDQLDALHPDGSKGGADPDAATDTGQESEGTTDGTLFSANASGESSEVRMIRKYLLDSGVPHRVTTTFKHSQKTATGNTSNHVKPGTNGIGRAADIAGLKPGIDTAEMLDIFNALYKVKDQLAELIYSHPDAAARNISHGKHHKFTGVTFSNHHNHVHVGVDLATYIKWKD